VLAILALGAFGALACPSRSPDGGAKTIAPVGDSAGASIASDAAAAKDAAEDAFVPDRPPGPYEVPFDGSRQVYYVVPPRPGPARLLANLHGVCNPPGYACGYWVQAGASFGFLVCPEGNSHCGPKGPPTWTEPQQKIDADLERAIAVVEEKHPGEISREGSILTGFSLGAYAAYQIARWHPSRWPYLVLTEADVGLDVAALRAAGVRAVAMIDGELGSQVAGAKRTVDRLTKQGYPARLWVMKGAGHYYSGDIDQIMRDAIAFVLSTDDADGGR
jgi:hypothetical protein